MRFRLYCWLSLFVISAAIIAPVVIAEVISTDYYTFTPICGGAQCYVDYNDSVTLKVHANTNANGNYYLHKLWNITLNTDALVNLSVYDEWGKKGYNDGWGNEYVDLIESQKVIITYPNGTTEEISWLGNFMNITGRKYNWHITIFNKTLDLPAGTNISVSWKELQNGFTWTVYTDFYILEVNPGGGGGGGGNTTNTTTTTIPEPPPNPITNITYPTWSSMWIDNDTVMIRLTMSWGNAYKIAVLDEDGNEIPFYASINGWYNGGNAEYTTATGHTLTLWRANITYNGSNYEGLQLKVDDSATVNLVLEAYPNQFYDYVIFLHLEGDYEEAVPVVTAAALPQGGVLDWLTGAFRWLHDSLMGTPLKPVVQAWDTISGVGWAFYETGKTLVNIFWGIFTTLQKMLPYLSVGIFLAFVTLLITRPLDTIQMMMDIVDWIKKTIGSLVELIVAAA